MVSGGEADGPDHTFRPLGVASAVSPPSTIGPKASTAVERLAKYLDLQPRWRLREGVVPLSECELIHRTGEPAQKAYGVGKGGNPAVARLRALGEALERFLTGPASLDHEAIRFMAAEQLGRGVLAGEASAPLLTKLTGSEVACYTYQALHPDQDDATIPLYLGAPWYASPNGHIHRDRLGDRTDYSHLSRYSVQSGYGLAPTRDQATVHAVLETIERDACSLLIMRTLIAGQPPTVIDPHTLPDDLALLHAQAQREVNAVIHLIDATSDLGVPTVLAYCTPCDGRPYLRGQAAALATRDAVSGAIAELLESLLPSAVPPPADLDLLKPYPALHRCSRFDLTEALRHARTTSFSGRSSPATPGAQLKELLAYLAAAGFTVFRRSMAVSPDEVSVIHAVIPGLERFFSIVNGALIVPGPRGRSY